MVVTRGAPIHCEKRSDEASNVWPRCDGLLRCARNNLPLPPCGGGWVGGDAAASMMPPDDAADSVLRASRAVLRAPPTPPSPARGRGIINRREKGQCAWGNEVLRRTRIALVSPPMTDFLILGGGMAGASAGFFLADHGSVTLLEKEDALGYHSTLCSAALFTENYGSPPIRALSVGTRPFLEAPPPGFADHKLLGPRGVLMLALPGEEAKFVAALADGRKTAPELREIGMA